MIIGSRESCRRLDAVAAGEEHGGAEGDRDLEEGGGDAR
jgi:hypothetical protein